MSTKTLIWAGLFIGSSAGSFLPTLFGQGIFSGWSILWSTVGGILGIWVGYKLGEALF
jgi:polyferredoxin